MILEILNLQLTAQPSKNLKTLFTNHFYDTRKSSSKNSFLQIQTTDCSTPVQLQSSNIIADESLSLEEKIETEFATLNAKILEQTQAIYKMEQNFNSLTNENLHLKSHIDKLENKLCHKITPTIPNNLKNCNDKGNHPKNNSNINEDAQPKTESQTQYLPKRNERTQMQRIQNPEAKNALPFPA